MDPFGDDNNIYGSFAYDKAKNETLCAMCGSKFKGYIRWNLKRHHEMCIKKKQTENEAFNSLVASQMHYIKVNITTSKIIESCLRVVTVNGKPFADLNSVGFRNLFVPYAEALRSCGLELTHRNVHSYIKATADLIRAKLTEELKDKQFNLMMDIATKNKRSILGVNTSCIIGDKTVIRTIAMQQLTERHTSENIVDVVIDLLTSFGLQSTQVFALIVDNAFNMLKSGELLDQENEDDNPAPRMLSEDEYEDAILNMLNDCEYYADLISNVAEKYASRNKDIHIKSTNTIGCASHTLHLAVESGIRLSTTQKKLIDEVRVLVKALRTPTILNQIQQSQFKLPQIDVPTRWNSKYIMLNSFWELKPFVEELQEYDRRFIFTKWTQLQAMLNTLSIAYTPSIKIQGLSCTLTDMWALWSLLLIQLEKDNSVLAINILKCLNEREHVVKNPTMFAALFLDPRYKSVLKPGEVQVAMCELIKLHEKIHKKPDDTHDRDIDELELMLMATEIENNEEEEVEGDPQPQQGRVSAIQMEFTKFKRLKRVDKAVPILTFWKENKKKFPLCYELAMILFAVPNGQTSVERAFSSLEYIYDRRRCNLSTDILNDILIIRLNSAVFDALDDKEWEVIIQKQLDQE